MKTTKTFNYLLFFILLFSTAAFSQKEDKLNDQRELEYQIHKMDSLLFDVAFNKCDLELYKKIMSPNLEFYDDRSGLTNSHESDIATFKDKCSRPFSVTRKLVNSTVHVLGDYGAVQIGVHEFYEDGKKVQKPNLILYGKEKINFGL